ncbi:MAG: RHS repeat-associated core domain-containing protein [Thermoanaerobaculia bacterium]
MQDVGAVVPLGIAQPEGVNTADPNASLAAFRVEVALPGSMSESTGGAFTMAIESERVPGAKTEASPAIAGWPASHLSDVVMRRVVPAAYGALRYQKGWNLFVSDPIVAIADPRAAKAYSWGTASPADQAKAGCLACEPPKWVEAGSREIYSMGRLFRLRPSSVAASPYGYLATQSRLETTIGTIMADTVRPPDVLVAAQNPPVADGMIQETVYLHSGELETSAVDLDAGGRAGWNVTLDRTYRARTVGLTPLGFGWDASYLKRLRPLPNRDVEYRDGAGEIWTFRYTGDGYEAPEGVFLKLVRTERSWLLRDQKSRLSTFDDFGRLTAEGDEFHIPGDLSKGNVIRYVYGADGRLARIVDPVNRATELAYGTDGLIAQISDWRTGKRTVNYHHTAGQLRAADLPEVVNSSNARPRVDYTYLAAGAAYNDQLELATNLESITDPKEALGGGSFRVKHAYGTTALERDRVTLQQWGTSPAEKATFAYPSLTTATTTDVLGQQRSYTLTGVGSNVSGDRVHVAEMRELAVNVAPTLFGQLPATMPVGAVTPVEKNRVLTFTHDKGMVKTAALAEVRQTTNEFALAADSIGHLVTSVTTTPLGAIAAAGVHASASLLPATSPIVRRYHYQSGSNYLSAVEEDGKKISSVEPHRGKKEPADTNDSVETKRVFDDAGQLRGMESAGGTDAGNTAGSRESIEYWDTTAPRHKRGLAKKVMRGTLVTTIDYPDENLQVETDEDRHVTTVTEFDAWRRPVKTRTYSANDPLVIEESLEYDASGRVKRQRDAKGSTEYGYDVLGRRTMTRRDGVNVPTGALTTSVVYDLPQRTVTTTRPGGATETKTLDKLGRTEAVRVAAGPDSSEIRGWFAYDLDGNRVYHSDGFVSSATAYDAHGRVIATKASDGTLRTTEYDTWSQPKAVKEYSAGSAASPIGSTSFTRSETGRLVSLTSSVDADMSRTTRMAWDGGGRTSAVETSGRASRSRFDAAGRLVERASGSGTLGALSDTFDRQRIIAHGGTLPVAVESQERRGAAITTEQNHDTAGAAIAQRVGSLEWRTRFDALGDAVTAALPGRPAAEYESDSRGAVSKEVLPGGDAENRYRYDATGAHAAYEDPSHEVTATTNDLLGRPLRRDYPDGTREITEWEGNRIKSTTDRQGRKLVYGYDTAGHLTSVHESAGAQLEQFVYDDAGRMTVWRTRDVELTWGLEFDYEGRPKRTVQKRFKDASGFGARLMLDEWVQEHRWNEHGERTEWSMPTYTGLVLGAGWTRWVRETHDAMGNVVGIQKVDHPLATGGATLMSADYRNSGRPDIRTVFAGAAASTSGTPIVRQYGYDGSTGLMNRMAVSARGVVVAGSEIGRDGLQISSERMLGVSGGSRHTTYAYDERSRLSASSYGRLGDPAPPTAPIPGRAVEQLTVADFRSGQLRETRLAAPPVTAATSKIDPPSMTIAEKAGGGHKIEKVVRGAETNAFAYDGAEVVDDGRFLYSFDMKGRLVSATEKVSVPPVRRILYTYSGPGRLVGRRAEYATVFPPAAVDWKVEDRTQILAADGLPAETTFVWDAITDRIVTVARAGATVADQHGGVLKQVIHGGAGYDDPIETATLDRLSAATVNYLYPAYDEAGAGQLEIVLNREGEIVARSVTNDPYGADPLDLTGAAVDRVKVRAKKANGTIAEVEVSIGLTETVAASSIAAGVRLAALDANATVLRTTVAAPSIDPIDATSIRWTLSAAQWSALTAGSANLSIAATNALRASAWGADLPVMQAPDWTISLGARSTAALPVEIRESTASLSTWLDSLGPDANDTRKLYEIDALPLLATSESGTAAEDILASRMQAHPFAEPMTGLDYVRARWYQPASGMWLTPDPMGYQDSSNMYAVADGDPANRRDPSGERSDWGLSAREKKQLAAINDAAAARLAAICATDRTRRDCMALDRILVAAKFGDPLPTVIRAAAARQGQPILYVNGINTPEPVARTTVERLSHLYNAPARGVWNPTQSFIGDASQLLFVNKPSIVDETTRLVVLQLRELLRGSERVTAVAHSQGAAVLSSALEFLHASERARVDVITFGGAAYGYPQGTHSLRVVVNVQDLVPQFLGYLFTAKAQKPVPGIEKVSFGHFAILSPGATHSINRYLDVEERRITGRWRLSVGALIDIWTE